MTLSPEFCMSESQLDLCLDDNSFTGTLVLFVTVHYKMCLSWAQATDFFEKFIFHNVTVMNYVKI